jgi:hypothetical protein
MQSVPTVKNRSNKNQPDLWEKVLSRVLSQIPSGRVSMSGQLLVRNVPAELHQWINRHRGQDKMSKQEFVLSLLHRASPPEQTQCGLVRPRIRKTKR